MAFLHSPPMTPALTKRLLLEDESAFVCFYIAAHYNALRLASAPLFKRTDDQAYLDKVRSMLHDLQIEDHYTSISKFAWKYAKLVEKQVKLDLSSTEPNTDELRSLEENDRLVHLVTGKKFEFSLDDLASRVVNLQSRHVPKRPIKSTSTIRVKKDHKMLICRVWSGNDRRDLCKLFRHANSLNLKGLEPVVLHQIDLVHSDIFDHHVNLSSKVHHFNGQYIKIRNQISFRAQLKIDRTLQMAPQFWVIKIPSMLLKRSTEVCCDPHRKSVVGPIASCVRSTSIESHWQQVLGPIFIYSAGQWTEVPKLIQPVMLSLSRLSFLLPPGEIQKELSDILFSFVYTTKPGLDLSEEQRNDYCLDEPQMVELVARNLLAYDSYLDVSMKTAILEWICNRMKMVNVSSVYFTSSMLQYLHFLAHGFDRRPLSDVKVDLLCKVTKLAQWISKMLDEDQKDLKQLVEEEEEEDLIDEEEEEQEGEETQEMSDSEESQSEMSDSSQDQTELETQEDPDGNEPDQSVPPFCATARLRTMARKLNHKCARKLDELNDDAH